MDDLTPQEIEGISAIAAHLAPLFSPAELSDVAGADYTKYQQDPVGFCTDVLKETLTDDTIKLMESVRDNKITIARSCTAPGKTFIAARIATHFYKCFPDSQVYTAAAPPEDNLKRLLWGEIGEVMDKHKEVFRGDRIRSLHVEASPKVFLTGVTIPSSGTKKERESKFSGKHAPNLLFILDEGDAIPDEVYAGIEGCMSGGNVRLLVLFNPRAEMGEVYRMERDGRANVIEISAFNQPNVITGENEIPGAVTRDITVSRINRWTRPLGEGEKSNDTFELPEFLVGAVVKMENGTMSAPLAAGTYQITDPAFSYMVLGRYPAQGSSQLISTEWIAQARSRWDLYVAQYGEVPPVGASGVMGLDVAGMGDDWNVRCCRYGGWVSQLVAWGGVDPHVTGERGINEYHKENLVCCNVDATGVGAGVAPHMAKFGCNAYSIKVAESPTDAPEELGQFKILRDQLWWACREWLRTDQGSMLPPDERLLEELRTPTYTVEGKYVRVMKKDVMKDLLKRSPDRADSLCLTFAKMSKLEEISDLERCFV